MAPEAVHVGAAVDVAVSTAHLLGAHVERRAERLPAAREGRDPTARARPKSASTMRPFVVDHDVRRLHVPVEDATLVQGVEGVRDACELPAERARIRRLVAHHLREGATFDQRHGVVRASVDLAGVVDLDDVRVLDAGEGLGLAAEALQGVRRLVEAGPQDLDGLAPAEVPVLGLVDDADRAPAQLRQQGVGAELPGQADLRLRIEQGLELSLHLHDVQEVPEGIAERLRVRLDRGGLPAGQAVVEVGQRLGYQVLAFGFDHLDSLKRKRSGASFRKKARLSSLPRDAPDSLRIAQAPGTPGPSSAGAPLLFYGGGGQPQPLFSRPSPAPIRAEVGARCFTRPSVGRRSGAGGVPRPSRPTALHSSSCPSRPRGSPHEAHRGLDRDRPPGADGDRVRRGGCREVGTRGDGPPAGGPPQMPPALVEVAEVVSRPIGAGRNFVGTVEPSRRSLVGAEFAGLVVAYHVEEGDFVTEKDPLAELRTEILDIRIEAAKADREFANSQLLELKNGSRPEEIQQARARVAQLEADLALRQWKQKASEELYEQNTISEDELRDARLAVRASELLIDAAKAALDLVEAGPRAEKIAQADAALQTADAEVRRLEEEKKRYVIRAPFTGWVVEQHAEKGQWLSVGSPVAEIVALEKVDVTVEVVEDFIGKLKVGDARSRDGRGRAGPRLHGHDPQDRARGRPPRPHVPGEASASATRSRTGA